ncbi:MAG TPA: outer membrane beta-barrel domain-containing protein [Bdellovibrionota bacterium]|jgi:outer membrane beta-barrel protein
MKPQLIAAILALTSAGAFAEEKAAAPAAPAAKPAEPPKNPESVDISGLEEDYWRPNKDELEVVQSRRYEKAHKWEVAGHYGIYQGQDYVNSHSYGGSLTYNFTNEFFTEYSYQRVRNSDNELLESIRRRYNFRPDFNEENRQQVLSFGWTPIYAKFSLLGKKISHFEMYFAPGIGITDTGESHLSGHLTIGQKFFITEHLLFRLDWRISKYKERVNTPQGSSSLPNGGPGYVEQTETTHNIIFGLGVMF